MAAAEFEDYQRSVQVAMGTYKELMFSEMGQLETVYRKPFKYLFQAYHPLNAPDKLLNGKHFPIAICFGDRDFMGSDGGATEVIKSNAFFKTGQSQLFKVPNSGHLPHIHNPGVLTQILIGFFNGTVLSRFEPKPRDEFAQP